MGRWRSITKQTAIVSEGGGKRTFVPGMPVFLPLDMESTRFAGPF